MKKATLFICACALLSPTAACKRGAATQSPEARAANSNAPQTAPQQKQESAPQLPAPQTEDADGYFALGVELYRKDRDREAVEAFRRAVELDPGRADAYLRLGLAHVATGDRKGAEEAYEKAVDLFEKRVKKDGKDADALYGLAEAYAKTGEFQKSSEAYRRAVRLREPDSAGYYDIGLVYNKLAKYDEAAGAFKKAVELDPNDYQAQEALDRAKEDAAKLKERVEYQKKLSEKKGRGANSNQNGNNNSNAANANKGNANL
jgi:tetratricopeptide (TPR) repeat protein